MPPIAPTYRHPLTDEEYDSWGDFCDAMVGDYESAVRNAHAARSDIAAITAEFDRLAGEDDVQSGTLTLESDKWTIKLNRKTKAQWQKERGKPHPLFVIGQDFEFVKPLFGIDLREKLGAMKKFLEQDPTLVAPAVAAVIERIKAIRKEVPGARSITVEPKKQSPEDED